MSSDNEPTPSSKDETPLLDEIECSAGGALEDDHGVDICHICEEKFKLPKLLTCLHEFCEECLKQLAEGDKNENNSAGSPSAKEWTVDILTCPKCEQKTQLPAKGVSGLPSDSILEDMIESEAEEKKQIECTSCKAAENAVARCRTCENLLCPHCLTAHKFMRCFEDHQVVTFEEMVNSGEGIEHLRKPIFCSVHPLESIKFFCCKCLVPACGECVTKLHVGHENVIKQLTEAVTSNKETLMQLMGECGKKLTEWQKINSSLNLAFEELEMQKDNTKGLIEETFQSYKVVLEETKANFLKELDDLHERRELGLMDSMHKVSNYENRLCQAKTFIERTCSQGHAGQIAQLLQPMLIQLEKLFMGFEMPEVPPNTEFKTNSANFASAVKSTFGAFIKNKKALLGVIPPAAGVIDFPTIANSADNLVQSPNSLELVGLGLSTMPLNIGAPHSLSTAQGVDNMPLNNVICGLSNLSTTVNSACTVSGNNSPLSDSGISVDNVSHSSGGNAAAMMNVAVMAKLQPQSPLFAPGMSIQGATGGSPAGIIASGTRDNAIAGILTDSTSVTSSAANSVQSANIEGLATLLNQPPPSSINTFTSVGSFDHFNANSEELGSPDSFSSESFASGRRSKMNPMQIRFQGGIGDTEIGHWGPQHNQVNEVALRCKFGSLGPGKGQFNSPHGFCLGIDEDIVVADTNNHRIQVFQKTGEFKYQFGIPGREEGQLWYPRKVAVILKTGKFVVCDRGNERSRMQIFNRNGHFLRKIAVRFIDIVAGLAITPEGHIVAVDSVSPTVFCISESGVLIKWFDCSDYMREPSDIAINKGEYFVCDFKGHCVVVFGKDGGFLRRIGCESITNYPNGIDISDHGDVLVGDSHGNRFHVGVFQRDGLLISEFQCPYVKVSRCCGLKITGEGFIVTLAKNNHHVLVLNTLYIQ